MFFCMIKNTTFPVSFLFSTKCIGNFQIFTYILILDYLKIIIIELFVSFLKENEFECSLFFLKER